MGEDVQVRLSKYGEWICERTPSETWAYHLASAQSLHLTGELHTSVWNLPQRVETFRSLMPLLANLAGHVLVPPEDLTVADLLRGTGFRRIHVELTGRCNERCLHCYSSSSPEVGASLDLATILSIVDDAASLGFPAIQFTGGDPLLSPHLVSAAAHAKVVGFNRIEVYTNGLALRRELLDQLAEFGVTFALSVYSHDPSVHDGITQTPNSLERTLSAIRLLLERGCRTRVGVVIREDNHDDVDQLKAMLVKLGVPERSITTGVERTAGRGSWDQSRTDDSINEHEHGGLRHGGLDGKVAVNYTGAVVPCIFDRGTILGYVSSNTSFKKVLNQRVSALRFQHDEKFLKLIGTSLGCSECRVRHELFKHAKIEPALG